MTDTTPNRPAMTMREIRDRLGHTRPDTTPTTADRRRRARWEAAAHAAGREVDRNALAVYMAVADAEQQELRAQIANLRTMYNVADARTSDLIDERDVLSAELTRRAPMTGEYANEILRLRAEVERLRTDRAAVLREAANQYATLADQSEAYDRDEGQLDEAAQLTHGTVRDVVAGLRRMADEAQQPETEAHEHTWVTAPASGAYARLIGHTWTSCTICGQQPAADQPDTETEAQR